MRALIVGLIALGRNGLALACINGFAEIFYRFLFT
jgi:hypothetical protein